MISKNYSDTLICDFVVPTYSSSCYYYVLQLDSIFVDIKDSSYLGDYIMEVVFNSGEIAYRNSGVFDMVVESNEDSITFTYSNHNLTSYGTTGPQKVNLYGFNFPNQVDSIIMVIDEGDTVERIKGTSNAVIDSSNIETYFLIPAGSVYNAVPLFEVYVAGKKYSIQSQQAIYFPVGFEDTESIPKMSVFPNPTTGIVNFSKRTEFQVLSIDGVIVKQGVGTYVDLTNFSANIYVIRVEGKSFRVVKN